MVGGFILKHLMLPKFRKFEEQRLEIEDLASIVTDLEKQKFVESVLKEIPESLSLDKAKVGYVNIKDVIKIGNYQELIERYKVKIK